MARLAALPNEVDLILEQWPPFVGDLRRTIEQERRWAADSVRYLRGVLSAA